MAHALVKYFAERRESFSDAQLTEVDSLILSTLAYLYFESGVLGHTDPAQHVPLPAALRGVRRRELFGANWPLYSLMGADTLLTALLESPRFMELEVGGYVSELSSRPAKQFSAITFFLPEGSAYVAYRGTDNSLAGGKEDLNLMFEEGVPSQVRARAYLEDVARKGDSRLYVGGHSKGGHLAEYAALTCDDQTYGRIGRVFNHDGPGFAFAPSARIESDEYAAKLSKTVPGSSVVGMLMEDRSLVRVVRSSGFLFDQHAPMHWVVKDGGFVELDAISPEASVVVATLNGWAASSGVDRRRLFVNTVFDVLGAAGAETWNELGRNCPASVGAIVSALRQLPSDMRDVVFGTLRDIASLVGAETVRHVRRALPVPHAH